MKRLEEKKRMRHGRKRHVRKKIYGTAERPRLSVFKSNSYMYAQVINDNEGTTLASISHLEGSNRSIPNTVEGSAQLGEALGKKLKEMNITTVVFDRNGYPYHGKVKSFADGTRKAGIQI
ncbi:MAG: 50S ribosomal protein L18 [Spirochaetales bacterium]|nr:50S ribosomal protein L18 [Spirochaetales bacterium]MCF7937801.1 50S ribosomal protein L18 [Spirochaetales bacterium]